VNYLAHIYLSGQDPDVQVGGLLGDFVKGPLNASYPRTIEAGIRLHRRIDSVTDKHEAFRKNLAALPSPWRRYGGILLDVYFDHLLARHWDIFSKDSLEHFCRNFYQHLHLRKPLLPERAKTFCIRAPKVNWLENYAQKDMIPLMLNNIGQRLSKPVTLGSAWPLLEHNRSALEQTFHQLMTSHKSLAGNFLQDNL